MSQNSSEKDKKSTTSPTVKDDLGEENAVWGLQSDADWRAAWSRLVAYSWVSDEKLQEVIADPIAVMVKVSNYAPPYGLFLRVRSYTFDGDKATTVQETPEYPKIPWKLVRKEDGSIHYEKDEKNAIRADTPQPKPFHFNDDTDDGINGWLGYKKLDEKSAEQARLELFTEIVFTLPPRPKNVAFSPLALADYCTLGKAFPFTSCII